MLSIVYLKLKTTPWILYMRQRFRLIFQKTEYWQNKANTQIQIFTCMCTSLPVLDEGIGRIEWL